MGRARTRVLLRGDALRRLPDALVPLAGSLTAVGAAAPGAERAAGRALVQVVRTRTDGPALNGALAGTGQLQLAFCVLLSAGILLC